MPSPAPAPTGRVRTLEAVLLAIAFAMAHTQSPLYYSNQNQYLLHGAVLGGHGHLAHDWLANTSDPTPLFSALVAGVYSVHPWGLQPAYFVVLMAYFLAVRWLVAAVPGFPNTRTARITFAALFTATHAAILRWLSVQAVGVDYPWYLQAGFAAQYLLGPGIQPSAFGVLLVFALAAFAHGRPVVACALAAVTCWFHSTYLLPAGLLVLGCVLELMRAGRTRTGIGAGIVALVLVVPVIVFTLWRFDPFGSNADRAMHILARVRIPHHCVPSRWFDVVAGVQLAWLMFGLLLARRMPFGRALVVAAIGGAFLTAAQLVLQKDSLALAFPWRISVLLVPVATAVIIARLVACVTPGTRGAQIAFAGLAGLVVGGVIVTVGGLGYRGADEHELYDFVRATAGPGDVYLIPTDFPKVGAGRGAVSNTFAPPPRAKEGTNQVPVDLQRFRLATGACLYVDFKSVPYAAAEVEEWARRMKFASALAAEGAWNAPGRHEQLKAERITHIVWPRAKPLAAAYLEETHSDSAYTVYRVR
ncbi:hypothetical protein VT84_26470 [Gemmata sp. SH-PL17]|uniref:DUF6798 domain-containing protein n=1 Tax=Gemmata sp. SH-PL17 TaxID=1630693 RepID=UPI00078B845F|nr:DUF6798 domain-containing protein [Gemmata sp. SH-PL17]AMV27977.1 hypothetical protein VT84_26470 [Gemmata sp. SH-PL17]